LAARGERFRRRRAHRALFRTGPECVLRARANVGSPSPVWGRADVWRTGATRSVRRDLPDLHAREHGDLAGDLDRTLEGGGLDEGPPADDLLALDVGPVAHGAPAAHGGGAVRLRARARRGLLEDLVGILGHPRLPLRVAGLHLGGRGLILRV